MKQILSFLRYKSNSLFICCTFFILTKTSMAQENLKSQLDSLFKETKGDFALSFIDLQNERNFGINDNVWFHAASTMKTPVMMEVMRQIALGKLSFDQEVYLKNEFKSIIDGSTFSLDLRDDSDDILYAKLGKKVKLIELIEKMITVSSNLATNLLLEIVKPEDVMLHLKDLGVQNIKVLRGVEDSKAFRAGKNNQVTAHGLAKMFEALVLSSKVHHKDVMMNILLDQKFNEMIPALLPRTVKVAHKTGNINGVEHDSGIVTLADGRQYVLVILSKNLENVEKGQETIAKASLLVYDYFLTN
jgi:beta-lactamase class A